MYQKLNWTHVIWSRQQLLTIPSELTYISGSDITIMCWLYWHLTNWLSAKWVSSIFVQLAFFLAGRLPPLAWAVACAEGWMWKKDLYYRFTHFKIWGSVYNIYKKWAYMHSSDQEKIYKMSQTLLKEAVFFLHRWARVFPGLVLPKCAGEPECAVIYLNHWIAFFRG
jgi:hypothetical protein